MYFSPLIILYFNIKKNNKINNKKDNKKDNNKKTKKIINNINAFKYSRNFSIFIINGIFFNLSKL